MQASNRSIKYVAATIALALASALSTTAWAMPGGGHGGHHGSAMGEGAGGMARMLPRMLDSVNATPEQRAQIKQIMDAAATDLRGQREARRALHLQTMQVFTQPTVDARAAEALRQQMLAQHDQSSKRMMQAMLDASRVLTPEQRKQMAETMGQRRAMMERHQRERQEAVKPKSERL